MCNRHTRVAGKTNDDKQILRQHRRLWIRDVHGNGNPMDWEYHGNPTGMGIKHRNWNGNGRECETRSVGMEITRTPMGMRIPVGIYYL